MREIGEMQSTRDYVVNWIAVVNRHGAMASLIPLAGGKPMILTIS